MAHEAGAVSGTWCFPPRVVLTVVFSLPVSSVGHQCPLPNPSCRCGGRGPDQPRTPRTSFALEMGFDGNMLAAPWAQAVAGDDVSPGIFCLGSPCLPLASLCGEFWDSLPM